MKAKDLRDRTTDDLVELKNTLEKELFSYKMKNCTSQLDDTSLLGKTKKDIARIALVLHERTQTAGATAAESGSDA